MRIRARYTDTSLGNVLANAVVCVNTADGTVRKTLDGDEYFSMVAKFGTTNTSKAASVYKVQYEKSAGGGEQWHEGRVGSPRGQQRRHLAFHFWQTFGIAGEHGVAIGP